MIALPKVEVKKILYATDLSDNARYAFSYAVSLANLYKASITILHVLPESDKFMDSSIIGYVGEKKWNEIKGSHVQEARESLIGKKRDHVAIKEILDQFAEDAKADFPDEQAFATDEVIVRRGNPVEEIISQCEERSCDLIVMGTEGHQSLADAMLGSTARRVIRRSKKPVVVIPLPDK